MSRKTQQVLLRFPVRGIDLIAPRSEQQEETCVNARNVRVFDTLEGRARGGIRPGLVKYNSAQINGTNRIQALVSATTVVNSSPSTSGVGQRRIRTAAVSSGSIRMFDSVSTVNAATASGSRSLSSTSPVISGTELFGRVYFTDGISYKIWISANNTATDWTPTAGNLPGTDGTIVARLITMWRSRIVLAGLPSDPHNYFMTKVGNPLDLDYSPATITADQAVAGDVGKLGKLGDVITALIPYNDDIMLFGCDHSIYAMSGDPQDGGGYDLISDTVGMPFGMPYCMDSMGSVYFFSSKGQVYRLDGPQSAPVPVSNDSIAPDLDAININTSLIRMEWDERQQGVSLFITPYAAGATTHWFYDARTQGWFRDIFGNNNHNPMTLLTLDADDPADRVILIGSEDGYVRQIDDTVSTDDGGAISSFVVLGPIHNNGSPIIITELQGFLDPDSSAMLYEIPVGNTPEDAIDNIAGTFTGDGTMGAGLGVTHNPRQRTNWAFIKVGQTSSSTPWAFEKVRIAYSTIETSRGRKHTEV